MDLVGNGDDVTEVGNMVERLQPLAAMGLEARLGGRSLAPVALLVASSTEFDVLVDRDAVRRRLEAALEEAGQRPDLENSEVELDHHLLGVARLWSGVHDEIEFDEGEPVIFLNAGLLVGTAQDLGVSLEALVLAVLLHEMVHQAKGHTRRSQGDREAIGASDSEVDAQTFAYEALDELARRDARWLLLARESMRAMHLLEPTQAPPYRVFAKLTNAKSPTALVADGRHTYRLVTQTDFSGALDDLMSPGVSSLTVSGSEGAGIRFGDALFVVDDSAYQQSTFLHDLDSPMPPRALTVPAFGPFFVTDLRPPSATQVYGQVYFRMTDETRAFDLPSEELDGRELHQLVRK